MSEETPDTTWSEADSTMYRALAAVAVPARAEQMATLLTLLPFGKDEAFRVVELAGGEGLLAHAILDCFPQATVLALDGEATMREQATRRLAQFGARAQVAAFDIAATEWLPLAQDADCVVSSLCVHHLDGLAKQRLFRDMAARLSPRGALLIADLVLPQRSEARELFAATWDRSAAAQSQEQAGTSALYDRFTTTQWNYYRYPDPFDQPSPLFEQLIWLKEASFAVVDCFWLRAGHAIYGGYKAHEATATSVTFAAAMESAQRAVAWQMPMMHLQINNNDFTIASIPDLRAGLMQMTQTQYAEVLLSVIDVDGTDCDNSLLALINGNRALLLYFHTETENFSSRGIDSTDEKVAFILSNGQKDEYPLSWTVSIEKALHAFEYFAITGKRDPLITWHDDLAQ